MSNEMAKFGQLTLRRSPTSLDEESNDGDLAENAGFSTIDLNGAHTPVSLNSVNDLAHNANGSINTYTSFGEAIAHGSPNTYIPQIPRSPINTNTNNNNIYMNPANETKKSTESINFSSVGGLPSSPTSVLSTASEASTRLVSKTASTIETIKQWSRSAYKCTRQIVSEKLGKSSRTIDPELELTIEVFFKIRTALFISQF